MNLASGTRLGPYEILAPLGAGGMGEVFRARDTRLDRIVAIKVLAQHITTTPELRERFEREARSISALDHPHICALYDVGEHDGTAFLVMQYLDGETLASRIQKGALPLADAVQIAIQIADALDRAHRAGIVHRDLKPANVMLTKSGAKLLDFGLAKMSAPLAANASILPTEHTPALTTEGSILGTVHYMAPEQLDGAEADARSDIFAFGCVFYEMLTGTRAFEGRTQASLVAAILERDPPAPRELRPDIPPSLERIVQRCLAKDPEQRWQNARDVMLELASMPRDAVPEGVIARRRLWPLVAFGTLALVVLALSSAYVVRSRWPPERPAWSTVPIRFTIAPPPGTTFYNGDFSVPFSIAPNGRHIVFTATSVSDGTRQLWLRPLDADSARPVLGTEGASLPFWSPDSEWIGFTAANSLKKVPLSGGPAQVLAPFNSFLNLGATWNSQGVILYAAALSALSRVSAQGGTVSEATTLDRERPWSFHAWPQFVKDGTQFVYLETNPARLYVAPLAGGPPRLLADLGRLTSLGYAPGHLLYVKSAVLYARPFDDDRLEFAGEAVRIADGIPVSGPGRAPFAVSLNGVLAYSSNAVGEITTLQWFDRNGRPGDVASPPGNYQGFSIAPDGGRLAFSRWGANGGRDIWLRDLVRGGESRLTSDGDSMTPLWAPQGNRVVFASARERPPNLYLTDLDTGTRDREITKSSDVHIPQSWSSDGKSLVYQQNAATGLDLWSVAMEDGRAEPLPLNTSFNESHGRLSPDGRWIAYVSNEGGRDEVVIARFPSGIGKRAVSVDGGTLPEWRADGRELFYISRGQHLMAVSIAATESSVDVGAPVELFRIDQAPDLSGRQDAVLYRPEPGGQRFLIAVKAPGTDMPPIHVIVNWPALLTPQ